MKVYTIGFTRKPAEIFFTMLRQSGAHRVLDVRWFNTSQLAGFTKRGDLVYFLRELCGMDYVHLPELAPTAELLAAYRRPDGDWTSYEAGFLALMRSREIEKRIDPALVADGCLLCSEAQPHHCHRRLVAEYLQTCWGGIDIVHLARTPSPPDPPARNRCSRQRERSLS